MLVSLVATWNPTIRLVADADAAVVWSRHVEDSLQLMRLIDSPDGQAADIGSGAGFPGMVLAIALDRHFYLVESDHRKAAFLSEAARLTSARVTIVPCRAEATAMQCRLVTARALASVSKTLSVIFGLLASDAVCLLPKGRSAEDELRAAAHDWRMRVERFPSLSDPAATILRLSDIARA